MMLLHDLLLSYLVLVALVLWRDVREREREHAQELADLREAHRKELSAALWRTANPPKYPDLKVMS